MSCLRKYAHSACGAIAAALLGAGCGGADPAKEAALGDASFAAGDWKKAAARYEKSLEKRPAHADTLVMLAQARFNLGELDAARAAVAAIPADFAADADVRLVGAKIDFFSKNHAAAREKFLAVAEDASLDAITRAEGWAGAGAVDCFLDGMANGSDAELRAQARTELLRALRLDRRNAAAHYHLGVLYRDSYGYPEAAKEQFDYFTRLAQIADRRVQDTMHKTIPALKNAIAAKAAARPGAASRNAVACTAALAKADALFRKNDFDGAGDLYAQALAKDPLSYPSAIGLARSRERSARTRSAMKKALDAYITVCEIDPGSTQAILAGAALAMRLERWATAAALYSRAIAASPSSTKALDGVATALAKAGRAKTAAVYRKYREFVAKSK